MGRAVVQPKAVWAATRVDPIGSFPARIAERVPCLGARLPNKTKQQGMESIPTAPVTTSTGSQVGSTACTPRLFVRNEGSLV